MPAISVIIPVFNVEAFLPRCLDSLLAQSFPDWEAVCVDDGSTDGSGAILDDYAARDPRFRVIHKANGGVSAARNTALPLLGGEYTLLMDSDDFLHPQLMEICLHFAERDGSDLVAFTYNRTYRNTLLRLHALHLPEPDLISFKHYRLADIDSREADDIFDWVSEYSIKGMLRQKGRWTVKHCQVWRCLYRTETIRDVLFPPIDIYEDVIWWGEVLLRVKTATILNLPLYYYYPTPGSLILASGQKKRVDSLREVIRLSEEHYKVHATPRQQMMWEREFLSHFRQKMLKKERRLARKKKA
ncbi:MAG: glycosyltransferase [Bacteroidales bacterium]|nr:glycosyltransferase [Bacteroidales bacterium]